MAKKKAKKKDNHLAWAAKAKKTKQTKTWAHIARLAEAGLAALEEKNVKDVRACLNAVRGVALAADEDRLIDFTTMDGHFPGSLDPQPHFVTTHLDHSDDDIVADDNAFVFLAG